MTERKARLAALVEGAARFRGHGLSFRRRNLWKDLRRCLCGAPSPSINLPVSNASQNGGWLPGNRMRPCQRWAIIQRHSPSADADGKLIVRMATAIRPLRSLSDKMRTISASACHRFILSCPVALRSTGAPACGSIRRKSFTRCLRPMSLHCRRINRTRRGGFGGYAGTPAT